jgi:hypothetical protein
MCPRSVAQSARIGCRLLRAELPAPLLQVKQNSFEVSQLLARQLGERAMQKSMLGVSEDQIHRGARGFFLAVGVVDQNLIQVCERALGPRTIRF